MSTIERSLRLQAERHGMVPIEGFRSMEEYCQYLIHLKAYETAAEMADHKSVLDCGCNVGYGSEVLSRRAKEVVGVDVSPKAIEMAQKKFGTDGLKFHLVDGLHLPFANDRFDLVVSFQVIEHIDDYNPYLTEIMRVLKDDGIALFTTPNAHLRLDPGMKPFYPFHVREFRPEELQELLQAYFRRVEVRGLFGEASLYNIECQRAYQSREKIRRRPNWINALSYTMRARLPETLLDMIRSLQHWRYRNRKLTQFQIEQYSTADLYYRSENITEALDLFALCFNCEK